MGIDGMSMAQIKQTKEMPSNHLSFEADSVASMNLGDIIREIDPASKKSNIKSKEDNYGEDVENQLPGGGGTSGEEETPQEQEIPDNTPPDNDIKKYCLKFSKNSDIIMLCDKKTQKVIQTIHEEELIELVSKFANVSGIIFSDKA